LLNRIPTVQVSDTTMLNSSNAAQDIKEEIRILGYQLYFVVIVAFVA